MICRSLAHPCATSSQIRQSRFHFTNNKIEGFNQRSTRKVQSRSFQGRLIVDNNSAKLLNEREMIERAQKPKFRQPDFPLFFTHLCDIIIKYPYINVLYGFVTISIKCQYIAIISK